MSTPEREEVAYQSQLVGERLIEEGERLLALGRQLLSQSLALHGDSKEEVIEEASATPEVVDIEEHRFGYSVGKRGKVGRSQAIEAAKTLKRFSRPVFADAMGLKPVTASRWIALLIKQKIIEREEVQGQGMYVCILPTGDPTVHPVREPHIPGVGELRRATGMPVRMQRQDRRGMSTPGQRQKMVNRERNYERMVEAKKKRAEAAKARARAAASKPKAKKGSKPVT